VRNIDCNLWLHSDVILQSHVIDLQRFQKKEEEKSKIRGEEEEEEEEETDTPVVVDEARENAAMALILIAMRG
jgi:hypothetical protein